MEKYVLIEKGVYQGQEGRLIKEDGPWLEVVVFGREKKIARSQVRFLPDNYRPYEGMTVERLDETTKEFERLVNDAVAINADQISIGYFSSPGHNEHLGPIEGKRATAAEANKIGDFEPITKEHIDKYLEEWPELDEEVGSDAKDLAQAKATIEGLRLRSKKRGKKHVVLSNENDQLRSNLAEMERDFNATLQDNFQIKEKNEFLKESVDSLEEQNEELREYRGKLIAEVNKGNEFRGKLKESIESLHNEIRQWKDRFVHKDDQLEVANKELDRANRIIDKLTEQSR